MHTTGFSPGILKIGPWDTPSKFPFEVNKAHKHKRTLLSTFNFS
jgi:hypothetical protein